MRRRSSPSRRTTSGRCRCCDVLVHVNALLPCVIVYWTLKVMKSAWLAVFLYESVCLVGLPWITLLLRGRDQKRSVLTRVRPLVHSLIRPNEWLRCGVVTTGSVLVFGAGGFFAYLAVAQREFKEHGITDAISRHSNSTGLGAGSPVKDLALIGLGIWFCTVNPVLEELFWRGYLYSELGRIINGPSSSSSSPLPDDDALLGDCLDDAPPMGDADLEDPSGTTTPVAGGEKRENYRRNLLQCGEQSELSRWLVSLYFGSFHGVVVFIFVDIPAALAVWAFLALASRGWIWLAERPPFGFPFIVAFHAGADVAVVLALSACDFGWTNQWAAYYSALVVTFLLGCLGVVLLFVAWRHDTSLPCHRLSSSLDEGLLSAALSSNPPSRVAPEVPLLASSSTHPALLSSSTSSENLYT